MKLHLFSSGTILGWKHLLVRGAQKGVRLVVPVPFYLIEHEKGLVLFDSGQRVPAKAYPEDAPFIPQMTEQDRAVSLLKKHRVAPEMIKYLILSHHHSDHVQGVPDFPGAVGVIQKNELEYSAVAQLKEMTPGRKWLHPEGEFDLFGDGRICCIPTFGHTAGHQSLLLNFDDGRSVLLAADAAYTEAALTYNIPEEAKEQPYWQSICLLRRYRAEGTLVITGHDPDVWPDLQRRFS